MPQDPAPMDQLRDEPLRFLETEQFQEMLSVYRKLKPDRKSTRLNSSHNRESRMPSSA